MGTTAALMLKTSFSLDGWMKMKGSWITQKMKNDRKSEVVAPWLAGTAFGRRAYEGQMAMIMSWTNWPPDHELIASQNMAMMHRDCDVSHCPDTAMRWTDSGCVDPGQCGVTLRPNPPDGRTHKDDKLASPVSEGSARGDGEGSVRRGSNDTVGCACQ